MKKEKHYNCSWYIPALLPLSTSCLLVMKTVVMTAAEMVMIMIVVIVMMTMMVMIVMMVMMIIVVIPRWPSVVSPRLLQSRPTLPYPPIVTSD